MLRLAVVLVLPFQNLVVCKQGIKTCLLFLHLKEKKVGNIFWGLHLIKLHVLLFFPLLFVPACGGQFCRCQHSGPGAARCFVSMRASHGLREVLASSQSRMLKLFAMLT